MCFLVMSICTSLTLFKYIDFLLFKNSGRNCDKMVDTDVTWWQEWWQLSGIKSNCPDVVTNNILTTFNLQCNQFRKIMTSLMIQAILYPFVVMKLYVTQGGWKCDIVAAQSKELGFWFFFLLCLSLGSGFEASLSHV